MRGKKEVFIAWLAIFLGILSTCHCILAQTNYGRYMATVQYDNARTGWNPYEVVLNTDNVNPETFGKKWSALLDGQLFGAPLYVGGVVIDGEPYNVVYVATENNLIYALNAEDGQPLWSLPYFLGTPAPSAMLDFALITPVVGITGTPVIDLETGTLYAVGLTYENGLLVHKMAAVDIATGQPRPGWPIMVTLPATEPLNPVTTVNHGALLLANGWVYVPFGSHGDRGVYHGWVVAVNPADPTAPLLYYRTPGTDTHRGGGIWAYGGIAADEYGYVYPATGNSFNAPGLDYSNAVLRLDPFLGFSESPADFFVPSNWVALNARDLDLGTSTPLLLPPQKGSLTPNMIFITGKQGAGHLLNRDNLGGVGTGDGTDGEGIFSAKVFGSAYGTAVYYEDPNVGPILFLAGRGAQPTCLTNNGVVALALGLDGEGNSFYSPFWCTQSMGNLVATPVVTSAPGQTGILWVVDGPTGVLYAFNAATGDMLYSSSVVPGDALGTTRKFQYFTAVDGKVFAGTSANRLVAYGLR